MVSTSLSQQYEATDLVGSNNKLHDGIHQAFGRVGRARSIRRRYVLSPTVATVVVVDGGPDELVLGRDVDLLLLAGRYPLVDVIDAQVLAQGASSGPVTVQPDFRLIALARVALISEDILAGINVKGSIGLTDKMCTPDEFCPPCRIT